MNTLIQDIRYAFRQLRKNPGFTSIAVLTLALGIAVNATMFSMVSGFLLQPAPGKDPQQLAVISSVNPDGGFLADASPVSPPNYLAWRAANHSFSDIAANDQDRIVSLAGQGEAEGRQAEALHADAVSTNYFSLFGVAPQLGRDFAAAEDQPGRDHVVILSENLWKRRYGSDRSILGRTVRLNREDYVVIGILSSKFRMLGYSPQLWLPLNVNAAEQTAAVRRNRSLRLFARLRPNVTLEQARAEFITLANAASHDFPETEKGWGASVRTLPDFIIYDFQIRSALVILMTTVGLVLMIACANVAGLLLARASGRQKELAIRMSLGASRLRIIRQSLTEGLLIALLGGGVGVFLSEWGIDFVRTQLSFNEALSTAPLSLDRNVLLFALGVSLISAVLCGLAPALSASATTINSNLKDDSRAASPGRSRTRLRTVLVTGEIALSLFLLVGTGLLIREIYMIEHQPLGFQPDHLLTAAVTLDKARYPDAPRQIRFVENLRSRLQQLPGVQAAAVTSDLPATGPDSVALRIEGQPDPSENKPLTARHVVASPDFFITAEVPLLRGRMFADSDTASAPKVALVNEEFVHKFLPGEEPLGKRIRLNLDAATPEWIEIVGVVRNVKTYSEGTAYDPHVYETILQHPAGSFSIMLRTKADPNAMAASLRTGLAQLDSELPLSNVMSMATLIDKQKGGDEFFSRVLGCFALLALVLAAVGIYGLIAYSVSKRTHEIGIRIAVGASGLDVLRMVLWEGTKMATIGSAIGVLLALPLPKLFNGMFYGMYVNEPRLYFLVPAVILFITGSATYIPARRAAKVDPMVALRYE
ncbi:MAG TPA: ABC transporter permease [Candidatus Sulfotelmatobacter sp.]|nr:ABC transporter permease [Candidatus Sulfotelmatobacter sp.]